MMHTICKYADNTELVISDIIKRENGEEIIKVVFERPTEHGFDTLIFELPSYKIVENDGNYTDEEIEIFKKVQHIFMKLLVKEVLRVPNIFETMRI